MNRKVKYSPRSVVGIGGVLTALGVLCLCYTQCNNPSRESGDISGEDITPAKKERRNWFDRREQPSGTYDPLDRTTRPEDKIEDIAGYIQELIEDNSDHDEKSTLHGLWHAMGTLPDHAEERYICTYEIPIPGTGETPLGTTGEIHATFYVDTNEELEEKVSEIRRRHREDAPKPIFPTSIDECNANPISTYVLRDSAEYNKHASEFVEALGEAQMIGLMMRADNHDEGRGLYANVDAAIEFYYDDITRILQEWKRETPAESQERTYVTELLEVLGGEQNKEWGLSKLQDFVEDGTY